MDREWFTKSNTLVCLETKTEDELRLLLAQARGEGIAASEFLEPDLDKALTAIALGPDGRHLVRRLPLALGSLARASSPIGERSER